MACMRLAGLVALLLAAPTIRAMEMEHRAGANPIRKVVKMLQMMQKKVKDEGEEAEKLYTQYMCYCKDNQGSLDVGVKEATDRVPALEASVEQGVSKKAQLESDLAQHKTDRKAAEEAMTEGTGIRTKEKAAFDKESAETKANLAAMSKAIAAISKGMGEGFLQTDEADVVRTFVQMKDDLSENDREDVMAFLSGKDLEEAAPAGGSAEILGILKQMSDEMQKGDKALVADEEQALSNYEDLMAAKKEQVAVLTKSIELKLLRTSDTDVEIATLKNDLEDTKESLAQDQAFLGDLDKNCKEKKGIHEEEQRMRTQEQAAIAETIKILNDDDALDLFKKTLPSGGANSFLQMQVTESAMRSEALALVKQAHSKAKGAGSRARLAFVTMALQGKKVAIDKIVRFIGQLVHTLRGEQTDDDDKKGYCSRELDETEDKKKTIDRSLSDLETVTEEAKETIERLTREIEAKKAGIEKLDKSVGEATAQRKEEDKEYKELMASDTAAKDLLNLAKQRLKKFYQPGFLQRQQVVEEKDQDEQLANGVSLGNGDIPESDEEESSDSATPVEQAESFLQMASKAKAKAQSKAKAKAMAKGAPPPPPEAAAAYKKKNSQSGGAISMINILLGDLEKDMVTAETEEKNAQEEYESMVADSAAKRAEDSKTLTDKEGNKAAMQATLETSQASAKSTQKELMGTERLLQSLHSDCDWLMKYYETRKEARAEEIDSLQKAKATLSGADYSLLQSRVTRRLRSRHSSA